MGELVQVDGSAGGGQLLRSALSLSALSGRAELHIEGGTHNPLAPPYPFLDRVFLP